MVEDLSLARERNTSRAASLLRHARLRLIGHRGLLVGLVGGAALSCSDSTDPELSGTFYGPTTTVGAGTGRTYVVRNSAGDPTELGVALSESALTGLPTVVTQLVLALPVEASATPYKHVGLDWRPTGHPPPMVYTVPHFDVHFYAITEAERAAQTTADPLYTTKAEKNPAADLIPTGYVRGGTDLQMGTHWSDPSAAEFNGQVFTRTFIYGSFDGKFIFGEPMVTLALLTSKPPLTSLPVKQPARYSTTGFQPTSYSVGFDAVAKEHRIALTGLVLR